MLTKNVITSPVFWSWNQVPVLLMELEIPRKDISNSEKEHCDLQCKPQKKDKKSVLFFNIPEKHKKNYARNKCDKNILC